MAALRGDVRAARASLDPARAPAQGESPDRPLLGAQRAPVLRAAAHNLLFKWFVDLNVEDEPFNATTFSKNRERLLEAEVARAFFAEVVAEAGRRRLLSDDHFSVDGTLLEAWASLKSYRPRDEQEPPSRPGAGGRNPEVDFRGQRRSRETHVSRTDAEARLYRKRHQQEAKLSYLGHVLSENRHGLVVDVELSEADGYSEREAAVRMLERTGPTTRVTSSRRCAPVG